MKHEYHEEPKAGENFNPTGQLAPISGGSSASSVSLIDYLLHDPKVDELEIPRDSDTGREIDCPTKAPRPGEARRRKKRPALSGSPASRCCLPGVIFNPPKIPDHIKGP
jgi:hypothetical protein